MNERILLAEYTPRAASLKDALLALGYRVDRIVCGSDTIAAAERIRPHAAIIEVGASGDVDGVEIGKHIVGLGIAVIYLADTEDEAVLRRAVDVPVAGNLVRPVHERQLDLTIRSALAWGRRARPGDAGSTAGPVGPGPANALKEQYDFMETTLDSISDGLIVTDRDGDYLIFNRSAKQIVGRQFPHASLSERSRVYGLFRADRRTPFPADELPLARALRNESTDGVEMFVRNEDRPEGAWISVSGRPLRDPSGAVTGGTIMFRDVTQLKKARTEIEITARQLHDQTQTMDAVFEGISDGVLVFDTDGILMLNNKSADQMIGKGMLARTDPSRWREDEGIFEPDEKTRIPVEDLPHMRAVRGHSTDNAGIFIRNPTIPNGIHLSVDCRPMYNRAGQLRGAVLVARDMTAQHRARQALTDAFAQGRLEILDTIVHNVGNAINSVSVGVGSIRDQVVANVLVRRLAALAEALDGYKDDWGAYLASDPQGRQVLPFVIALAKDFQRENEKLARTIERVVARVTHIVEIVRTQTSRHDGALPRTVINLGDSIGEAAAILGESIAKRSIRLDIDCARAPKQIRTQASNFHQMVVNLIKNSVDAIDEMRLKQGRATDARIAVEAYVADDSLVIDVTDNGIGIDAVDSQRIFFPGYTTKTEGTGLGLHSAANYVIGAGGTITPLSGGIGHGATMRIAWRLPSVLPAGNGATNAVWPQAGEAT